MSLNYPKFLLFGDSITQFSFTEGGFGGSLQAAYTRKYDIVCRGFSGYNTDHAVIILPEILKAEKYKIMTIFFGTNDALSNFQGVPLESYRANLDKLVKLALEHKIKIVVISCATHDSALWCASDSLAEAVASPENNKRYANAARQVAEENKVGFVDLFDAFANSEHPIDQLLSDGVHYTPQGYKLLYDGLIQEIGRKFPEELPENNPFNLALWREYEGSQRDSEKIKEIMFRK